MYSVYDFSQDDWVIKVVDCWSHHNTAHGTSYVDAHLNCIQASTNDRGFHMSVC